MATVVDSLVYILELDASKLTGSAKSADAVINKVDKTVTSAGEAVDQLGSKVAKARGPLEAFVSGPLTGLLAKLGGAYAIRRFVNNYNLAADSIGKFANQLRLSVNEVNAWQLAVQNVGGTTEGLRNSLDSLNSRIQAFITSGASAAQGRGRIFEALGVDLKAVQEGSKNAIDILLDLSDAAQRLGNDRFVGLAQRIGIDSGTIRLLQQGRSEVEKAVAAQRSLAFTDEDAANAARYTSAWQRFYSTLRATGGIILREVLPSFNTLLESVTDFIDFLRNHETFIKVFFTGIGVAIASYAVPALYAFLAPIAPIIAAFTALALVVDDFITYINGGQSALHDFWSAFGEPEEVKAGFITFINTVSDGLQYLTQQFRLTWNILNNDLDGLGEALKLFFIDLAGSIYESIKGIFTGLTDYVADILSSIYDTFTGGIRAALGVLPEFLQTEGIQDFLNSGSQAMPDFGKVMNYNLPASVMNSFDKSTTNSGTTVYQENNIDITAPSSNAYDIANSLSDVLHQQTNTQNTGVRQ